MSYHRLAQVPTCSPFSRLYVPHKKLLQRSAKLSGAASSKQTMNNALSTICKQEALFLSFWSKLRKEDHILRFSVERRPIARRAASCLWVLSASRTIACRFRKTSRSVKSGRLSSSRASNQSAAASSSWQHQNRAHNVQN